MTERATINQVVQIAPEATHGSEPTTRGANIRLRSIRLTPQPQFEAEGYRGMGQKFLTGASVRREWMQWAIEGQPDYNELIYLLASILGTPTPTQQGATAAYKSDFTPDNDAEDTVTSLFIQHGDENEALEALYNLVTELSLTFNRSGIEVGGSIIGQRLTDDVELDITEIDTLIIENATGGTFVLTVNGQTTANIVYNATADAVQTALETLSNIAPGDVSCSGGPCNTADVLIEFTGDLARQNITITIDDALLTGDGSEQGTITETRQGGVATELEDAPIEPPHVSIYLDTTGAGIGVTQLTRVLSAEFNLSDRFAPGWFLNRSVNSWACAVESEPAATLALRLMADDTGMDLLDNAREGDKRFIRIECIGPLIESTYYYTLQFDLCGEITEVDEPGDEDAIYAIGYTFSLCYDPTWAKALDVDLINKIATL